MQKVNDSVTQALQAYAAEKDKQRQEALQQHMSNVADFNAIKDNLQPEQITPAANAAGIKIPAYTPPTPSTGTVAGPTPVEAQNQQSMPSEHPAVDPSNSISPIVQAHAQATGFNPLGLDMSKVGIAKRKQQMEMTNTQDLIDERKNKDQPVPVMTREQALAAKTVNPRAKILEPLQPKDHSGQDARLSDKQLADAQAAYNRDTNIQKSQAVIDKVSQAVPLLQAGTIDNATAKQALQTALTYTATGGMRVNATELQQMGGAQTVTNKMAKWFKGLDEGTLTPRDAKDMANVLQIFQKSAEENLHRDGMRHTNQYLQRSQSGEDPADAYERVTGNKFPQERLPAPDGRVTVIAPDGKTVGHIPQSQLKDAIAQGYKPQ